MNNNDNLSGGVAGLLAGDFFLMVIPESPLFGGAAEYKLSYSYPNPYGGRVCRRRDDLRKGLRAAALRRRIGKGSFAVFGLEDACSLVFTDFEGANLFPILQKHYAQRTCFVFCSAFGGAYFKKLEGGRISRKISSFMPCGRGGNYPEVRGKPCEFELETGRIYELDRKAKYLKDMLKDFGRAELIAMLDYYVGLEKIKKAAITDAAIYSL